jgi:4-diphosphocytidyl-2-C-methyl-D-erythritol kinase
MTTLKNQKLSVIAPSKLNLTFEIIRIRNDGYHDVSTILQAIDLVDTLHFSVQSSEQFSLELFASGNGASAHFPLDESNLICKASNAFNQYFGSIPCASLRVAIEKKIPIGSGLAGGSADAAATLMALNELYRSNLQASQLSQIAASIGSDIPFLLEGGTAFGQGRGDEITSLANKSVLYFLIAKPIGLSVSTPWAYKAFDEQLSAQKKSFSTGQRSEKIAARRDNLNLLEVSRDFGNDFEDLIFSNYTFLSEAKQRILDWGCISCHMTGSGPTIFALMENERQAKLLAERVRNLCLTDSSSKETRKEEIRFECWTAKSIPHGVKILATR